MSSRFLYIYISTPPFIVRHIHSELLANSLKLLDFFDYRWNSDIYMYICTAPLSSSTFDNINVRVHQIYMYDSYLCKFIFAFYYVILTINGALSKTISCTQQILTTLIDSINMDIHNSLTFNINIVLHTFNIQSNLFKYN